MKCYMTQDICFSRKMFYSPYPNMAGKGNELFLIDKGGINKGSQLSSILSEYSVLK